MSLYEYEEGSEIAAKDPSFYALIQAAMRRADTYNLELLQRCWPNVWRELMERYNAPGGKLQSELEKDEKMRKDEFKDLTAMELFAFQSEVMSRTPKDTELQEQIYEELKRRRNEIDKKNRLPGVEQ